MAVQSIAVPPDTKRDARARDLADQVGSWPLFVLMVVAVAIIYYFPGLVSWLPARMS